jgi:phage terminase large subunit
VAFLQRQEDEVLYGGAAGGGKTDSLLIYSIRRRVRYPGSKGLFLRRTYADLSKAGAALDRSRELLTGVAEYNSGNHRWTFANGSLLEFGYLDHDGDKYKYQGSQYDDVCWDELTQFTESQYLYLLSRCRATVDGIKPRIRAATNPGGVGHQWVKRRFIDGKQPEQAFLLENGRTGAFIPAKLQDNQILMQRDPGYWLKLMALSEDDRRALAYGDWDVFAGQYFKEWRRDAHVVDPFTPPTHWRKWCGFDWGYAKPLSFGVYTQDPDTMRIFRIRELYAAELRDSEAIARIKAIIGTDRIDAIYADPSIWQRKSDDRVDSLSTAEIYVAAGLPMQPANNDRLQGWRRLRDLLADGKDGKPMFQVTANCTEFIRTLPGLVYDQAKPEDLDSDGEDHAADECRYALMARATEMPRRAPRVVRLSFGG